MHNIDEYADFTNTVWKDPQDKEWIGAILALGLVGEAGEVVEKIKKAYHYSRGCDTTDFAKELGDVAFYWARLCRHVGLDPSQVLALNVEKLSDRLERGVVWGEGSNR
jgi:NTP pyrophosphatase (non-canonical NTP hydrolase)